MTALLSFKGQGKRGSINLLKADDKVIEPAYMRQQKNQLEEKLYFKTNKYSRGKIGIKELWVKLLNPYTHIFQNVGDGLNL